MGKNKFLHIDDTVKKIITDALCLEKNQVKNNSLLKQDLGAAYLEIAVIQMNLEETFEIMIPDKDIADKNGVSEIIDYIKGKISVAVSREEHHQQI